MKYSILWLAVARSLHTQPEWYCAVLVWAVGFAMFTAVILSAFAAAVQSADVVMVL
jgi:hypothetical protein